MDIYARSGEVKCYDQGVEACKDGDYTNSTYFYIYLIGKYMRLPNSWKAPKMYNPLGMLCSDPIAPK